MYVPYYVKLDPEDHEIASRINHLRRKLLVHSYIYYELDMNIVDDNKWMEWAQELVRLQAEYPRIAKKTDYNDIFEGWDGASGSMFDYDSHIISRAMWLVRQHGKEIT